LIKAEGWINGIIRELIASWAIAKKDVAIYYFKPNILVSSALFPLFMFLAFAVGRPAEPLTLVPGLIAITILFSSSSIEPVSIPIERRMKTFDRLLSAPISLHAIILGESLSGFFYSIVVASVPFAIGLVVFWTVPVNVLPFIAGVVLTAFCFATMGTLFASYPTDNPGDIMSMLNLVRLPLIFISGIFVPLSSIPFPGQYISFFSPLTYGADLIKGGFDDTTIFHPLVDIAVLCFFILFFQVLANMLYKKFNE
jgi:ABC-2 type transport system permease protein